MIGTVLSRLRGRATWLRHTYPFQLAHGPLCERHVGDTVRLAHVFVCRSCLALYATVVVAAPLLWWAAPSTPVLLWSIISVGVVVLPLSWPPLYRRFTRGARDLVRSGAGLLAALVLVALLRGAWWVGGLSALFLSGAYLVFAAKRRAARVRLCDGCPELGQPGVCSGYARQATYLRRYEDVMTARLSHAIGAELVQRSAQSRSPDA